MYNPYFIPYTMPVAQNTGLLSSLFGGSLSFGSILNGTSKALNVVNQTIPLIKQASPILKNAKTMFKVMNEFKKDSTNNEISENNNTSNIIKEEQSNNGPTFFM